MIFIWLTFLSGFAIESLGTVVSVIGLSALFGANPIITALVIALDAGKLVVVTLLYKYWRKLPVLMRGYAMIAALITMTITSTGAAGYLSAEFQQAIVGTQEGAAKVEVLKTQQSKYEERKKQIDAQIAALPEKTSVTQRLRLMNGFKAEQTDLQAKINEIDAQLPKLQVAQIGVEAHAGPILYIAKAFGVPVEVAVKYVILMIISVFDLLAVFLIIAGNFLIDQRKERLKQEELEDLLDLYPEHHPGDPVEFPYTEKVVFPTPPGKQPEYDPTAQIEDLIPPEIVQPVDEAPEPAGIDVSFREPEQMKPMIDLGPVPVISEDKPPAPSEVVASSSPMFTETPAQKRERQQITLSSLGVVKPDPNTTVNTPR